MEAMYEALAAAAEDLVPSGSAADICAVQYWGHDTDRDEPFYAGAAQPVGQGACGHSDGGTLFVTGLAQSRIPAAELQEAKWPVLFERWELAPDSAGVGKFRGGMGWDVHWRFLEDVSLVSTIERTREPGWAQRGGRAGSRNRLNIAFPDGRVEEMRKVTDLRVPKGSVVRIHCGGGGGYGMPSDRDPAAVREDLEQGYLTEAHARAHYPQAYPEVAEVSQ